MLAQLAPQINELASLAEQNADPAEVAKMVMDLLPQNDQVDQQLYNIVSNQASFARLLMLAPKSKPFGEWFERLRVALLAEFSDDETPTQ